jgi:hypothetical protein
MNTNHRVRAVLNLDKKKIPAVLSLAKAIYTGMGANPTLFPSPNPPLPTLLSEIQTLDTAQQAVRSGTKGLANTRNVKRDALVTSLENERMYVQTLCDANPDEAVALITAAEMAVGKAPTREKPVLKVKPGAASGSVDLAANASILVGKDVSRKALFNWQYSADGGKTWIGAPPTPFASTQITGLTPAITYAFRVSATVSTVTGPWSPFVSILVP